MECLPFEPRQFSLVVVVHFVPHSLRAFAETVAPGGHLYVETFGGHGENWRELPTSGTFREALGSDFSVSFYKEKQLGKLAQDAVSVRLFATRNH
jgi:hypothetical protein